MPLDAEDWDRLPDRFGFDPAQEAEWRDLAAALRRAVDDELTARQRQVFVAIVLNGVPWMPWSSSSALTATRSTRCCSTPGVSCGLSGR